MKVAGRQTVANVSYMKIDEIDENLDENGRERLTEERTSERER
jgi:hypothetical protein